MTSNAEQNTIMLNAEDGIKHKIRKITPRSRSMSITAQVEGIPVKFNVDKEVSCSLMPIEVFRLLEGRATKIRLAGNRIVQLADGTSRVQIAEESQRLVHEFIGTNIQENNFEDCLENTQSENAKTHDCASTTIGPIDGDAKICLNVTHQASEIQSMSSKDIGRNIRGNPLIDLKFSNVSLKPVIGKENIEQCAEITKKEQQFVWDQESLEAFESLVTPNVPTCFVK